MQVLCLKIFTSTTISKTTNIDHYNSNLKWVDVNGRCNYSVDASYLHLKNWQRKYKEGQCQIMKIELKIRAGSNPMKLFTP